MTPRTSLSHPLQIGSVACAPLARGTIGITFCPGKWGDSIHGAPWQRDIDLDLDAIRAWGADLALSMLVGEEFALLRLPRLGEGFGSRGIAWHHLPIQDLGVPDEAFQAIWSTSGAAAISVLRAGGKVLVHCRGGLGRAGTVACMLLMELGANGSDALRKVRAARPGAVETKKQERYLATYSPQFMHTGS